MYYDSGKKKKKKTEKSKNAEWINLTTIISYLPFYYPEVKEGCLENFSRFIDRIIKLGWDA